MVVKRRSSILLAFLLALVPAACGDPGRDPDLFSAARSNGESANEGFRRCDSYLKGWLDLADPETGLIPRNTRDRYWNAQDAAADNYAFMVLTASFTDRPLFRGRMREMLDTETRLTSRLGSLPDTYDFGSRAFLEEEPNLDSVIFGSSEYVKDGLLPLAEWLGPSPWSERMLSILDGIWSRAPLETSYGRIVSDSVEVNGEMLQVLSRVYWMTGDIKYLEWALRLGDYYLLGGHHPTRDLPSLRLRDHGCEIVSGLCELYATTGFARPEKKEEYREPVHEMLDRILEVGRNGDGLFYDVIDPVAGRPLTGRIADTWGYTLNGIYTVFLVDRTEAYREAVLKALGSIDEKYRNYEWEGESSDGYADAIESALNLYNREPAAAAARWIDSEIRVMWAKQQENGVIEGWHGDGNFARTSIMYSLWKTGGTSIRPWRADVVFGAARREEELCLTLSAASDWSGELLFDLPRHRLVMNLPLDWPRINQFPEWFTVEPDLEYQVETLPGGERARYSGERLGRGIPLRLAPGQEVRLAVRPVR